MHRSGEGIPSRPSKERRTTGPYAACGRPHLGDQLVDGELGLASGQCRDGEAPLGVCREQREGERAATADVKAGRTTTYGSSEEFLASLS